MLEVTESVLAKEPDVTIARLEQLSALGIRLAIDDFGTGYSSLSRLRRFPLDILKIDRSFLSEVGSAAGADWELTRAIVRLGQTLGLKTVAEGIEEGVSSSSSESLAASTGRGTSSGARSGAEKITRLLREERLVSDLETTPAILSR